MLPNLPTKHKKDEADFGLKFRTWILNKPIKMPSGDYELKDSRGKDSIAYSEITEEQLDSAKRSASDRGNLIRIVAGTPGAPDYSYRRNAPTFFVIHYPKCFEVIPLDSLLLERSRFKRKSLTSERARAISIITVKL